MQGSQEINWLAILAPSLIVGLSAIIVQIVLAYWLSRKTADYQKEISEKIEDYKKEISKELENYKFQLQSDFQKEIFQFQNNVQKEQDKNKLILSKIEKIYELTCDYKHSYEMSTLEVITKSAFPNIEFERDKSKVPREELKKLVNFYAPELTNNIDILEMSVKEYEKAFVDLTTFNGSEDRKKQLRGNLRAKNEVTSHICQILLDEAINLSKKYF